MDKASGGTVTQTRTYYPAGGATLAPHCVRCSAGVRIGSTLYYVLKDHLSSASVITNSSGVTVSGGEQRYYPFGESRLTATMLTDKLFTSQREMAGLGIYHYGARFYSPKLGRFIQPDTIVPGEENPQAWNRYSYVFNNPIKDTDPNGHCPTAVCGGLGSTPDIHVSPFQPPRETGTINIKIFGPNIFSPIRGPLLLINGFDGLSSEPRILFSKKKKPDIDWFDDLAKRLGITKKSGNRRKGHDEITRKGLTPEEIIDEMKELKRLIDKRKNKKEQDKE